MHNNSNESKASNCLPLSYTKATTVHDMGMGYDLWEWVLSFSNYFPHILRNLILHSDLLSASNIDLLIFKTDQSGMMSSKTMLFTSEREARS